ncbi:MAG: hypothetical protein RLY93_04660 [Sumerlaeia bacterium]
MRTVLFPFCLLALIVVAAGCASGRTSRPLVDVPLPDRGEDIDPAVWQVTEATPAGAELVSSRAVINWLPLVSNKRWFETQGQAERAASSHVFDFALGIPYWNFPIWRTVAQDVYQQGEAEPVGRVRHLWTPLWTGAKSTGEGGADLGVQASGVPLLWETWDARGSTWYFDALVTEQKHYRETRGWQTLMSFGPAWARGVKTEVYTNGLSRTYTTRRFFPLKLGGLLGWILWSDYSIVSELDEIRGEQVGHGPLGGLPTYYSQVETDDVNRRAKRFVLMGLAWYDSSLSAPQGTQAVESVHGPLWGLFGWGRQKGEPVVYLFRVPVGG